MPRISLSSNDDETTLSVHGSFTFETNREFRDTYRKIPADVPVTVDLSDADYIDSAALGMLIRLREHVGGDARAVRLVGANETIRTILEVANFGRLFTIA